MSAEKFPKITNKSDGPRKPKGLDASPYLSDAQRTLLGVGIKTGRKIQEEMPDLATDYLNGLSFRELAIKYEIKEKFGLLNAKVAEAAVFYALHGLKSKSDTGENYAGLIPEEVSQSIGLAHRLEQGKATGTKMRDEGRGLYGMSPEQKLDIAKRSGEALYANKIGMFSRTPEQRSADAKRVLERRGIKTFSETEESLITQLAQEPRFRTTKRIKAKELAAEINRVVHNNEPIRSGKQIKYFLYEKKRVKKHTENEN